MRNFTTNHKLSAIIGLSFAIPFIVTNFIISLRIEPIYSFISSFPAIRNSLYTPLILISLFPVGALIAILPVFKSRKDSKKILFTANSIIATILLVVFVLLFSVLAGDFYRCEVLKIPNCD